MKKRGRLFIVLLVVVLCGIFLYPTVKWYVFVPQETKDLATGSRTQIREYARGQATRVLRELKALVKENPESSVPEQYKFLIATAKENYKLRNIAVPRQWTMKNLLSAFPNEQSLFEKLETSYRQDLLSLKQLSGKVLQLGLDLRGGMSILLEADTVAYESRMGKSPTGAEVTKLVE
ncbi:MAG: protein translocase subunit SecD, partial [Sphaerochaetaceae bacterium]